MKLPKAPLDNRTYSILVAEDDETISRMLELHLKSSGFEVALAANGTRALELFNQSEPHLVLSDIQMPGMNGHDLTRQIRAQGSGVPILLMTAAGTDAAEMEGFKTGADDYIEKPFNPKLLLARVVANLRRVYRYDVAANAPVNASANTSSLSLAPSALPSSVNDAAKRAASAIAAMRPGAMPGVTDKELPEGWSECDNCGYIGPQFKFEGNDPNGNQVFICPNCKSSSLTFSLG